jgi:hypothetical protein
MDLDQYIRFWQNGGFPLGSFARSKSAFKGIFAELLKKRVISKSDLPQLAQTFTKHPAEKPYDSPRNPDDTRMVLARPTASTTKICKGRQTKN